MSENKHIILLGIVTVLQRSHAYITHSSRRGQNCSCNCSSNCCSESLDGSVSKNDCQALKGTQVQSLARDFFDNCHFPKYEISGRLRKNLTYVRTGGAHRCPGPVRVAWCANGRLGRFLEQSMLQTNINGNFAYNNR